MMTARRKTWTGLDSKDGGKVSLCPPAAPRETM